MRIALSSKNLTGKLAAVGRAVKTALTRPPVRFPLYFRLRKWNQIRKSADQQLQWEKAGRPSPPPHIVKECVIRLHANRFGIGTLVETGTGYGDMVEALRSDFDRIYSIELSERLHRIARRRFSGVDSITLIQGDSAVELGNLLASLDAPALFWLDGHYSSGGTARGAKDTPIQEELDHIFNARRNGDVILIDDARCFGAYPDYPDLSALQEYVRSRRPDLAFEVENDIIRLTPARAEP